MKKLLCLLLSVLLILPAMSAMAGDFGEMYVITDSPGERLNLRKSPAKDAASLGKYYAGVKVALCGNEKNGYVKVSIGGVEGWMDERFLSSTAPAESEIVRCNVSNRDGTGANLRTKPSKLRGRVITLYGNGQAVSILGVTDSGWAHVQMEDGVCGYMQADLLSVQVSFVDKIKVEANEPGTMMINTGSAQSYAPIYAEADKSSEVLGELYSGGNLIVHRFAEGGWSYVWAGHLGDGWIRTEYLVPWGTKIADNRKAYPCMSVDGYDPAFYARTEHGMELMATVQPGETVHIAGITADGWLVGYTDSYKTGGLMPVRCIDAQLWSEENLPHMMVVNPDPDDRLNLRAAPGASAEKLGKFYNGTQVTVVAYNDDRSWAQVLVGGQQGWMDMSYLTADPAGVPFAGVKADLCSSAMLCFTPDPSGGSYGPLPEGSVVTVLGLNDKGMCYVTLERGTTGWVDINALDVVAELSWEKY